MEIGHNEKIKTFHEDQDVGVVVFAFKCKSAGIGLSYIPGPLQQIFFTLASSFRFQYGKWFKGKGKSLFYWIIVFLMKFFGSSISNDLFHLAF